MIKTRNSKRGDILISIIVPIYNIESYVAKCIDSVINQSYQDIEIVLVDDGSTDKSGQICDKYQKQDDRIVVIHKENGGLVSARKAGTRAATGDYILNVDGDDWIEPDRVLHIIQAINEYGKVDVVYLNGVWKDRESGSVFLYSKNTEGIYEGEERVRSAMKHFVTKQCFKQNLHGAIWCYCVRRNIYINNQMVVNDRISHAEDLFLIYLLFLSINSFLCVNSPTYHYVSRSSSMSQMVNEKEYSNIAYIYKVLKKKNCGKVDEEDLNIRLCFLAVRMLISCDHSIFMENKYNFLFPFSEIKEKSNIIIYGSGKYGRGLVKCISNNNDYNLVMWIDKNYVSYDDMPAELHLMDDVLQADYYDYIAIAIIDYDMACTAKKYLVDIGVEEEKISMMDPSVICEENLPYRFLKLLEHVTIDEG